MSIERINHRRDWPWLTVGVGLGLLLAGCGGSRDERTIVYNAAANVAEIAALRPAIEEFHAASGIRVKLNPFSGEEKLYAMIAAGQAPDVFYTNNAVRDRLAAEGHLLDLRPFAEADPLWARLRPEVRAAAVSVDGGIYSLGNWTHPSGVYYNRAAFAAAGVPEPTADWTWSDLRAAAHAPGAAALAGKLFDGIQGMLRRVAENREYGAVAFEVDGVIAPFAAGNPTTVLIKKYA
jgi:multiple sugar transport system substrate-binding protein